MKKVLFILLFLLPTIAFSQSEKEKLAAHYFSEKEYDKAAELYKDLTKRKPSSIYLYDNYLNCLFELKEFNTAEKLAKRRVKQFPQSFNFKVDVGYIQELKGSIETSQKTYDKLIKDIVASDVRVTALAKAFERRNKTQLAISTYIRGRKVIGSKTAFTMDLAMLYIETGNSSKTFDELINLLEFNEGYIEEIKNKVISFSTQEDYKVLQEKLINKISKNSSSLALNDLLMWTFVQQKDWNSAFIQTRAIDKRLKEDGERMLDLGAILTSNYEYGWAAKAYQYIVDKGEKNPYKEEAKKGLLDNRFMQMEQQGYLSEEELIILEKDLKHFINQSFNPLFSIGIQRKLAQLNAYYKHDLKTAISILEKSKKTPRLDRRIQAEIKLELGDMYLMSGDVWEPALLYAQVEKDYLEDALGQEAKFRNARLAYFRGEFEWAQTQLNVLKAATTQLIANNAIKLSLFITDNMGLDSTEQPMILYSRAELLIFQNRYKEAIQDLEAISILYPNHTLDDEILFSLGVISEKKRDWNSAINYYNKVAENYSTDILADNALFKLGDLYQFKVKDKAKAQTFYERIILDYSSSMFVVEARKRYRSLRRGI